METAKKIIRENKLASAMAATSAVSSLPYLVGTLPYVASNSGQAIVCATFGAAVGIPLAFYTGRAIVRTYNEYSWKREHVLENPKRFVLQSAKLGFLLGTTCCFGADLAASIFMIPFAVLPVDVSSGFHGVFNGVTMARIGLFAMYAAKWGGTGGLSGAALGALVFLFKK